MTTQDAFKSLISNMAACAAAGIHAKEVYNLRNRFKSNSIGRDKMEGLLAKAGYVIKRQTEWFTPAQWEVIANTVNERLTNLND